MRILSKTQIKNTIFRTKTGRKIGRFIESASKPLFRAVEIETTSICNRKCAYCPVSIKQRPGGQMENKVFYKIISELKEVGFSGRIAPHFYGEPLLDKRLASFLAYARKNLTGIFIEIYTNGDFLTYELFTKLIESGADIIRVSLHDEKAYKRHQILKDRLRANGLEKRLTTLDLLKEEFLSNRAGLVLVENPKKYVFCKLDIITINYKGEVVLCCQDYFANYTFGNVTNENLVDIWNKSNFKEIRDRVRSGNWPYELCRTCTGN